MLSTIRSGLQLVLLAGLAGCTAVPAHQQVDWRQGARRAWISTIYTVETPRSELPACLADLPAEQLSTHRFVKVRYRHVRRMLVAVAELPALPDGYQVAIDDRVEVFPQDCSAGQLSRIARMLPVPTP